MKTTSPPTRFPLFNASTTIALLDPLALPYLTHPLAHPSIVSPHIDLIHERIQVTRILSYAHPMHKRRINLALAVCIAHTFSARYFFLLFFSPKDERWKRGRRGGFPLSRHPSPWGKICTLLGINFCAGESFSASTGLS